VKPTYVTRIETNVKSKRPVAFDLSPCTLIVGTNGSGKSALVDAISLALTGASRTEGLKKQKAALMRLAPPGPPGTTARELYARAQLADGTTAKFAISPEGMEWAPGGSEVSTGPSGVIITDVARALLYGDAKSLMEAIARSTHAVIFRSALENEVTKGVLPLFNDIWVNDCQLDAKMERTIGEVEKALVATQARIKAVRSVQRNAKSGTRLTVPLNDDEERELTAAVAVLAALRHGQTLESMRDSLSDLPPYNPEEHVKIMGRVQVLSNSISTLGLVKQHAKVGNAVRCPCCGKQQLHSADIAARLERLGDVLDKVRVELERSLLMGDQHDLYSAVSLFMQRGMAVGDVQARRAELLSRKESAAAEPVRAAVKAATEEEINQLDMIEAVCREAIKNATDQQLGTVERRINRALPKDCRARVISEGGYRIELVKGKDDLMRDFRALSGGERALLLSAFASATIPDGAPPVRLLVVDETWLGAKSMRALLKALVNVVGTEAGPSQAIVCAVDWKGKLPDGWSEIKLAEQAEEEEEA
jgi:energy-coupling factor transporter ATP-binding protein EcfA2